MRAAAALTVLTLLPLLQACGENCQSTCRHVYDEAECGVVVPGVGPDELIRECVNECENAMKKVGQASYDPTTTPSAADNIVLQNETEAANWIDCVWSLAPEPGYSEGCKNIDPAERGVCAPI